MAHHVNGHTALGTRRVIRSPGPSEEVRSLRNVFNSGRIYETGHEFAVVDGVGAFHHHGDGIVQKGVGGCRGVAHWSDEGDHHTVLAVFGANYIHGEVLGGECHGVVHGNHGGHIFAAFFGFMEDVEFFAVAEVRIGDGHLGRLSVGRLPLLVFAVGKGDVISGEHGVALLVLALHGFHMHASICRNPTRYHEID